MKNSLFNNIYQNLILVSFGYLLLFCYGVIFKNLEKNKIKIISLLLFGILFIKLSIDSGIDLQSYKYPPRGYYFYYAILMFNVVFYLKNYLCDIKLKQIKIIGFVGRSTMWIYLWHIPFVMVIDLLRKKGIETNYIFNYIFIFGGALIITVIQNKLIDLIFIKENPKNNNIRDILLG